MLCLVATVIYFFIQQYIIFSEDSLSIDFHYKDSLTQTHARDDEVKAELVTELAEKEGINNSGLSNLQAVYIPYSNVSEEDVSSYLINLEAYEGNAVILQLKPESGQLVWNSESSLSTTYGTSGSTTMRGIVNTLHDENIRVAADISCFVDSTIAVRNKSFALTNRNGDVYSDTYGSWLDPYHADVQNYLIELVQELCSYGFDEIILSNYCLPIEGTMGDRAADTSTAANNTDDEPVNLTVYYVSSSDPAPITNVLSVLAEKLYDITSSYNIVLSIRCDNAVLRDNGYFAGRTGQQLASLSERFNRIYTNTDTDHLASDTAILAELFGNELDTRFVPIMRNSSGDKDSSWVIR